MEEVDFHSLVGKVRLTIGDFNQPFRLPDTVIVIKLEEFVTQPTSEMRVWRASLACLQVMIADAAANASRLREREGGVELEEYRNERYQALKAMYEDLLANPPEIPGGVSNSLFIIGGTSKKESERICNDPDIIRTPFKIGSCFDEEY